MFCPQCGSKNRAHSKFCMKCGAPLIVDENKATTGDASRDLGTRRVPALLLGGVGLLVLLALSVTFFMFIRNGALPFLRPAEKMLVSAPSRNGKADLYLLSPGQPLEEGILVAEDVRQSNDVFYTHRQPDGTSVPLGRFNAGDYGAFIPGSNQLLFWYREDGDDDVLIQMMTAKSEAPSELMKTDALPAVVYSYEGRDELHLMEDRNSTWRCYTAQPNEKAQRLTKGDNCNPVAGGALVYSFEEDGSELTLSIIDLESGNEELLLDEIEGVRGSSLRYSDDGSHIAYTRESSNGAELFLTERANNEVVTVTPPYFSILQHNFIPGRDVLYYLAENDDGDIALYLTSFEEAIASGHGMQVYADRAGNHLLYIVGDEDGDNVAYVYDMRNGEVTKLREGENLEAYLAYELDAIFLWEQDGDEYTLYSASLEGGEVTRLFETDDVARVTLGYVPGAEFIFLEIRDVDGQYSLWVNRLYSPDGFYVLEEWDQITLLNISPNYDEIVFVAIEDFGDDPILLLAQLDPGVPLVELDTGSEGFPNAVFSANGRDVLYTASTGDGNDEFEVVRISSNGEGAELLYEEAYLDAVSWATVEAPFLQAFSVRLQTSISLCPGARVVQAGEQFEDQLEAGATTCYRFRAAEGEMITFALSNMPNQSYNFQETIFDRDGTALGSSSFTQDPWLTFVAPAFGYYFLGIDSNVNETSYQLRVAEGNGEPAMAEATPISPGQTQRGAITSASYTELLRTNDSGYGEWYYIDTAGGEHLTIDVLARSEGSDLDPQIHLYDAMGNYLDGDDDSGLDTNARLTLRPSVAGRYYLLVMSSGSEAYGTEDDFFYQLRVKED